MSNSTQRRKPLSNDSGKKRILLVDDDLDNSAMFRLGLEDDGFKVNVYNDPELALSAFKPNFYDLLILDIKMPKMNGYELYRKLNKIDDKVKTCFLTASMDEYKEEYRANFASSDCFLIKPITIDDLIKKVNEIIQK